MTHSIPELAAPSPTTAATPPSTSASANSCMMMRPRPAPNAERTMISLSRVAARANIRSATFPQMSATSMRSGKFTDMTPTDRQPLMFTMDFAYGMICGSRRSCVSGNSIEARLPSAMSSARASSSDAPGARRANALMAGPSRRP